MSIHHNRHCQYNNIVNERWIQKSTIFLFSVSIEHKDYSYCLAKSQPAGWLFYWRAQSYRTGIVIVLRYDKDEQLNKQPAKETRFENCAFHPTRPQAHEHSGHAVAGRACAAVERGAGWPEIRTARIFLPVERQAPGGQRSENRTGASTGIAEAIGSLNGHA
jgi:hypothetical protein